MPSLKTLGLAVYVLFIRHIPLQVAVFLFWIDIVDGHQYNGFFNATKLII